MSEISNRIEQALLLVHRLNGGTQSQLNLDCRLADPALYLDPIDVAQLIAAIEGAFGCSLRRYRKRIETWKDLAEQVERCRRRMGRREYQRPDTSHGEP